MSVIPHTEIETDHLLLRPVQRGDRPDIVRILSQFDVTRWLRSTPHPYPDSEADTVSGLIMEHLGRIANVGDEVDIDGFRLRVVEMEKMRIVRVLVREQISVAPRP